MISLVERVAADDSTLNETTAAARVLTRSLILPSDIFPLPSPLQQRPSTGDHEHDVPIVRAARLLERMTPTECEHSTAR